jgi:hypothetical protein
MFVQCTCEKSELTTGAPRRVILTAPHMAPSVLLKDYQNQVDVVSDVKRTEGDYDSASRPRGIFGKKLRSDQQIQGENHKTSEMN